jgi:hypothetical protein
MVITGNDNIINNSRRCGTIGTLLSPRDINNNNIMKKKMINNLLIIKYYSIFATKLKMI